MATHVTENLRIHPSKLAHPEQAPAPEPATRNRLGVLKGVQILAVSGYVPPEIVRNEDLAEEGYDADWIRQRTGILARCRAPADWANSDVSYEAARLCLDRAQTTASSLDLIIVATMTPDSPTPSTACRLQQRLQCTCPAMDLNAACAGFMYGLVTGMHFVRSGSYQRVLVVGSDLMSRVVNPADRKTFPLFGDGAGAVLLGPGSEDQGLLAFSLGADGSGCDVLQIPGGGTREPLTAESLADGRQYLHMDGRAVFKWAVRLLADAIADVLQHADLKLKDVDLFVLHQANRRILDSAAESLGIPPEKVLINLDRYGNTSAGSIPLALDEAFQAGKIRRGSKILMCGFGAGLAWGATVMQW